MKKLNYNLEFSGESNTQRTRGVPKKEIGAAATAQKDQKSGTIEEQLKAREKIREARALNNTASPSLSNSQVNNSQLEDTRNTLEPASFTQAERSIAANQNLRDSSILEQSINATPGNGASNEDDDSRPVLELLPLHMVEKVFVSTLNPWILLMRMQK
ncbi:hypothetical protein E3Q03_00001 [Wallemia mellicola]|uniref:Uncharacterized protein n=1 Tax=Wallemia mellicola TaxID=1708541 RepID=A0AB74KJK0_9BASI|nr:hypothetical protein E3Q03_00001 [Wallemia mellicola]